MDDRILHEPDHGIYANMVLFPWLEVLEVMQAFVSDGEDPNHHYNKGNTTHHDPLWIQEH